MTKFFNLYSFLLAFQIVISLIYFGHRVTDDSTIISSQVSQQNDANENNININNGQPADLKKKPSTSKKKTKAATMGKAAKADLKKKASESMEIEQISRAFPIWIEQRRAANSNSSSHPYDWCVSEDLATNDKKSPKGLLFVKIPKSSSSTGAGVTLRIRDGLSKRLDRVNKNKTAPGICFAHYRHAVAAKRNFQNRDPAHSFLWSIVREPAQRTLR